MASISYEQHCTFRYFNKYYEALMYITTCWSTYNVEETSKHPMQILFPKLLPNVHDRIPLYKIPQSFHPHIPLMLMPMTRIPIATYYRDPNIKIIKKDLLGHRLHEKILPQYTSTKEVVPYTALFARNINFPYYFQHTFSQVSYTFTISCIRPPFYD